MQSPGPGHDDRGGVERLWWRTVLMVSTTAMASSLPVFFLGALAVQVRADLDFGRAAQGAAVGSYFLAAAIGARLLGGVTDRIRAAVAIRSSIALTVLTCLGIIGIAQSWPALCLLLCIAGVGNGLLNPALARVLAGSVPAHRQALGFGVKQAAVTASTVLGGLAVPLLVLTHGWRSAFVAAAVFCGAVLFTPHSLVAPRAGTPAPDPAPRLPRSGLRLLAVAFGLGTAAATGLTAFVVDSAVAAGVSPAHAGVLLALASAGALTVRIAGGWIVDRRFVGALRLVAGMLAVGTLGLVLLSVGTVATVVPGLVMAYTIGWGWVGLIMYSVVDLHRHAPGMATGVAQSGAAMGGFCGPLLLGLVAAHGSYRLAWLTASALTAAAAGCVAIVRRTVG